MGRLGMELLSPRLCPLSWCLPRAGPKCSPPNIPPVVSQGQLLRWLLATHFHRRRLYHRSPIAGVQIPIGSGVTEPMLDQHTNRAGLPRQCGSSCQSQKCRSAESLRAVVACTAGGQIQAHMAFSATGSGQHMQIQLCWRAAASGCPYLRQPAMCAPQLAHLCGPFSIPSLILPLFVAGVRHQGQRKHVLLGCVPFAN